MSFSTEEELLRRLDPQRLTRGYGDNTQVWLKGTNEIRVRPSAGTLLIGASQNNVTLTTTALTPGLNEELDVLESVLMDVNHVDTADLCQLYLRSPEIASPPGGYAVKANEAGDVNTFQANSFNYWRWPTMSTNKQNLLPVEPVRLRQFNAGLIVRDMVWLATTTATVGNRAFVANYRVKNRRAD